MASKQVKAGVLDIACEEAGAASGTPVVLLHGFPYDVHAYGEVAPKLAAAGCRVITPYLRGYGPTRFLSPDTPRSGQQAALAFDLLSLLDALEIERAVVAGYDWGGRAACIASALWPQRVRGLVTGGGYNIQYIPDSAKPNAPEREHQHWYQYYFHGERGRAGLEQNRRAFCRLLWRLWSPQWKFDDETYNRTATSFDNPDFVAVVIQSYRHRYRLADGDPALEDIERRLESRPPITVPTVVLHGDDNGVSPVASSESHRRHFTGPYERRVIPRVGHNLPQEAPEEFAAAVHIAALMFGCHCEGPRSLPRGNPVAHERQRSRKSMSTVAERIGAYVADLQYDDLGERVIDYAKRILLDSLACAYGGADSEPAKLARAAAHELNGTGPVTIWADGTRATAPLAALANGVAIRYQDYNDVYFGPAWTAHPSDNIATLFAVAEWEKCSGTDFLLAMVTAYEVQMRFSDLPVKKNLWHAGWHHTAACAYAAAAGVSKLMKLDAQRTAHAITLAGARSNTFAEIRHGEIPMDKALSAPIMASQSILYALLARRGFTGSATLLEGDYGFRTAVAGGIDVTPLVPTKGDFRILKIGLKPYPVEGMTPAMVQAAIELREEHKIDPAEVQAIRIFAHEEAVTKPSWDDKKLAPTTKETADHSFYYCVAVGLAAGKCTSAQFTDEWLRNPTVAALMAKSTLEAKPELTALFEKGARPAAVEIRTARGTFYREVLYPRGDPNSPMTWDHIVKKLSEQAASHRAPAAVQRIAERTASMEKETDLRSFAEMLAGKD